MNSEIKKIAKEAVMKAGKVILEEYDNFDRTKIKLKSRHEIVTRVDLLSEEILIKEIRKNFPLHSILSEEKGIIKNVSEYLWIIDPLDGTTNFSMHNPFCSISLALAENEEIILGIVYAPILGEFFMAEKNMGAELNGKKIKVSESEEGKIIHSYCHGNKIENIKKAVKYYNYQKLHGLDCRQLGSAALELAYVASGRIDSFVIPGPNLWDIAGGIILVKEAGGKITDFKEKKWEINSNNLVASNGKIHKEIIKVINKI